LASYPALDLHYSLTSATGPLEDLLYAELDAFEPLAIHDLDSGGWRVFFSTAVLRDAARASIASTLGDRLAVVTDVDVDDEDWARRSQAALTRVQVGGIIVAPPWDVPSEHTSPSASQSSPIVIVIEPSMGFGTGHHATTRLCLQLLQECEVRGRRVIDVGTGSGVLAIAAWTLGAGSVTALDYDADALTNARENVGRNGALGAIDILQADLSEPSLAALGAADVVMANLTGAVLQRFATVLRRLVSDTGTLIVSGFSPEERSDVVKALGGAVHRSVHDGDWAAAAIAGPFDR
jgi:ribosomal protein L11 methyltransferase